MIDLNELLLPISENDRCGEDLKYDFIYDQIKEFRREDDARLSQGVWQTEPKKANWPEVKRLCCNLLKAKTKDLQIAMWLLESLTVMENFRGFNQGVLLLQALCENFWDDLHPLIDRKSNSFVSRLSPFYFFAEKIQERLALIPLLESMEGLSESNTLSDWMMARHNLQIKNSKGLSLKQLKKNALATSVEFFKTLETEVELSLENSRKLSDFLYEKCGNEAPSFRIVFDSLEDVKRINSKNLEEKQVQTEEYSKKQRLKQADAAAIVEEENSSSQSPRATEQTGPTLEEAYRVLEQVAAFLEKEQPQSPAATLIKIAAIIGKKNFQELLEISAKGGASVMNTISELHRLIVTSSEKHPTQ